MLSEINHTEKGKHYMLSLKCGIQGFPGAQWERTHLPLQETWVQSVVQEDPTHNRATESMRQNYGTYALETKSCNYWRPPALELMLWNERSHCNEKSMHQKQRVAPTCTTREKPSQQ